MRTHTRWNDSDDEHFTVTTEVIPTRSPVSAEPTAETEDPATAATEDLGFDTAGGVSQADISSDMSVVGILERVGILDPTIATASVQALCDAFLERSRDDIAELLLGKGATQMEITSVLSASKGDRGRMGVPDGARWGDEGWAPEHIMKDKAATAPEAFVTDDGKSPQVEMCSVNP